MSIPATKENGLIAFCIGSTASIRGNTRDIWADFGFLTQPNPERNPTASCFSVQILLDRLFWVTGERREVGGQAGRA
jgi:hypothetical protein